MNSNLNNGVSMFTLQNSIGEVVDLDSDDLFGYTPTGLGAVFSNSYSQYDSYFKPTKKTIQQGQMSLNILFGSVESNSYQTFSEFASFLAYEPLTLIYTTKSESWYRDAVLSSLTKTEIGGTTVIQVDRLVEQFTIDFINPWYNNKTADYKSYDADPNLALYGKGYFNEINPAKASPNLLLGSNTSITSGQSAYFNQTVDRTKFSGAFITGSADVSYKNITAMSGNKRFLFGVQFKNTSGTSVWLNVAKNVNSLGESFTGRIAVTLDLTGFSVSSVSDCRLYIQGLTGDYLYIGNPKLEFGKTATPWTPAVLESKTTWNYGYFNANSETIKKNQAYADLAKTDITYIEN